MRRMLKSIVVSTLALLFISCKNVGVLPASLRAGGDFGSNRGLTRSLLQVSIPSLGSVPALQTPSTCPAGYMPVADAAALNNIRTNLTGNYCLTADILLTGSWTPIGDQTNPFSGNLYGANHTISGIEFDNASQDLVGLFSKVTGEIWDLVIKDSRIVGRNNLGLLAGISEGTIVNLQVRNSTIKGKDQVGGFVGWQNGFGIENSHVWETTVEGTGENIGGLIGNGSNLYLRAVTATNFTGAGVDAVAAVVAQGNKNVGGLIGFLSLGSTGSTITNGQVWGKVTGSENVGGLVGGWGGAGSLSSSSMNGTVTGTTSTGGLVGDLSDQGKVEIKDSHTLGTVTGTGSSVGGLIGAASNDTISQSYAKLILTGGSNTGGLAGMFFNSSVLSSGSHIERSYVFATITGTSNVGGLVGSAYSTIISDAYLKGSVTGTDRVGGIMGFNTKDLISPTLSHVSRSYVNGSISGTVRGAIVGRTNTVTGGNTLILEATYYDRNSSGLTTDIGDGALFSGDRALGVSKEVHIGEVPTDRGSKLTGYYDTVDGTIDSDDQGNDVKIFEGWDFVNHWKWTKDGEWPELQ